MISSPKHSLAILFVNRQSYAEIKLIPYFMGKFLFRRTSAQEAFLATRTKEQNTVIRSIILKDDYLI